MLKNSSVFLKREGTRASGAGSSSEMLERQRTLTSTSNGPQDLQTHTEKPREKLSAYAQTKKQKIALSVRPEKNP